MPKVGDSGDVNLVQRKAGHFGFSAVKMDDLGASEYTLVVVVEDHSGSVVDFRVDMENALKEIVKACAYSDRADNLVLRVVRFDDFSEEVHGFKLLSQCNVDDYNGVLTPGNMTALYDAAANGIESVTNFGKELQEQDFNVNAIVFVVTDGCDNRSTLTPKQVKEALGKAVKGECLESLVSILIGVNITEPSVAAELQKFNTEAGFTQYVELADANKKTLAKLAQFVSKSISSQSQALGTGGPSQSVTF